MALSRSQAQSISDQGFDDKLSMIAYEDSALLTKLNQDERITRAGGQYIMFPVRHKQLGSADAVDPDVAVGYEQVNTRTSAQFPWAHYEADTMITWKQRNENSGKYQVVDLVKDATAELREDFNERLATDLYTTNPNTLGLVALPVAVDAADTYGDIAVADATNWAAGLESASVTLTLYSGANSLAFAVSAATFGKKRPTIHMTTRNLQNTFEGLMAGNIRYEDVKMANAGFENVTFRNAPVIGDDHCPASTWYGLDTDCMELVVSQEFPIKPTPWIEGEPMGFPNALVKVMTGSLQLVFRARNSSFKYTALVYTN